MIFDMTKRTGGGGWRFKSGTFTPASTTATSENVSVTTVSDIGFSPTLFVLSVSDKTDVQGMGTVLVVAIYVAACKDYDTDFRFTGRYANVSDSFGGTMYVGQWDGQQGNALLLSNGAIYFRASTNYRFISGVKYEWYALAPETA